MNGAMYQIAAGVTALYGVNYLALGLMGYLRGGSLTSLFAGGIAGIMLILGVLATPSWPVASLVVVLIQAQQLVGRFAVGFLTKSGEMTDVLFTTAIVMVVDGIVVLLCAGLALMSSPQMPR